MKNLILSLLLISSVVFGQTNDVLNRLTAIETEGKIWYNIDNYSITSESFNENFDEKGLKKVLKKHSIKPNENRKSNANISAKNFMVSKQKKVIGNIYQTENYYFIENAEKNILVVWFIKTGKIDLQTEEALVNLILENKIPQEKFVSMEVSSIDFAGRNINIDKSCYWTAFHTIQCPYFGAMNWSIHKDLDGAKEAINIQLEVSKQRKDSKIISEEWVDIEFEGVPTKAKKVILGVKGITSVLARAFWRENTHRFLYCRKHKR